MNWKIPHIIMKSLKIWCLFFAIIMFLLQRFRHWSSIDRCTWWTRKFPLRNQRPRLTMSASLHYWHNTTIGGIFKRPHALLSMSMMIWRILLKIKFHFEWPTNFAWSMAHWGIWLLRAITSQGWHAAWRPPLKWKDWRESFCWYHKVIPRRCLDKSTK